MARIYIKHHAVEFKQAALVHLADLVAVKDLELMDAFVVVVLETGGDSPSSLIVIMGY